MVLEFLSELELFSSLPRLYEGRYSNCQNLHEYSPYSTVSGTVKILKMYMCGNISERKIAIAFFL